MSLLLLLLICEPAPAQTKLPVPELPATAQPGKLPPAPPSSPTQITSPDDTESEDYNGDEKPAKPAKPQLLESGELKDDPNPLNPVGDNLDRLIQLQMSNDTWKLMLGDLPCLEATDECIKQLQSQAIQTSATLKAIDQRVEAITQKVEEAKKNNQATVRLGVFEPLVQSFLKVEDVPTVQGQPARKRGFLDNLSSG